MKNFNKIIILILSVNFLLGLYSVFLLTRCDLNSAHDCLLKNEDLFADFYYQYNTLKYTGIHGIFPSIGIPNDIDGGFDGASIYGKDTRIIYHPPLYYYLSGFIYVFAKSINVNDLLILHIFSVVVSLFTNILFYFFIKKLSKYVSLNSQRFIIYSLVLFIFLPTPMHISLAIQSEGLFYLSIIASLLIYLHFLEHKTVKNALYLGLIAGSTLLIHMEGLVIIAALFVYTVKLYIEKKQKDKKLISLSLIIASVLGAIPMIRNQLLTGHVYGDALSRSITTYNFPELFYKVYTGVRAFWAGIYGGLPLIGPLLFLIALLLTLLAIIGLVLYFKSIRKRVDLDFIILTYVFTAFLLFTTLCWIFSLLKTGTCYGRGIQNRYALPFATMIPLFSTIALIKFQDKKPYLKYSIYFSLVLTCLVFIIDFISALI